MATEPVSDLLPWEFHGHDRARELLRQLPARSLLFTGPDGVGRRQLARWYAALLNCAEAGDSPCGRCASCRLWHGGHPDYLEIAPAAVTAAGRTNRKPEIRISQLVRRDSESDEPLAEWLQRRPLHRWRVGVIDSADRLTAAAANSFLKTLEEPPSWVRLILIAPDRQSLLPTIASRVTPLRLGTVDTRGLEPADHPAHLLGTPGPLRRATGDPAAYEAASLAVRNWLTALDSGLLDAFNSAAELETHWLGGSGTDLPQLLRSGFRSWPPAVRAAAEDALADCEEQLASYVSTGLALQLLTLRLRRLLSSSAVQAH